MKKKLKIFLLAILALIVVGGGYLLYIFQFKEYEVADEEVDEIMENPYDITLPNGTKLVLDSEEEQDGKKKDQTTGTDSKKAKDSQTAGVSSSNSTDGKTADGATNSDKSESTTGQANDAKQPSTGNSANTTNSTDKPAGDKTAGNKAATTQPSTGSTGSGNPENKNTVATIKKKYEPTVNELQGQVDSKIDALIGRAKNEYSTKKANGESVNYAYFYNKYMTAAEGLEAQTDAVFNGVVKSLEKDLQANGYDKSYSQSVKDEYAAQKKARRDSIMSKAMGK